MIDRQEMIEEILLRENIRKIIKIVISKREQKALDEDQLLRSVVRKMLKEEKAAVADDAPHEKTGINYLRMTLKKIIPSIKDVYMSLTTNKDQRDSYIAHLINGVDNLLAPIEINADAPEPSREVALGESDLEEEVVVSIGGEEAAGEEGFIDIGDIGLPGEEEEVEEEDPEDEDMTKMTTGMNADDHDETGRNAALATFKQVQGNIVDDFEQLAADEDRELYHDYIKTNILLWRDRFEGSLSMDLPDPSTPEYEKEKEHISGGDSEEEVDISSFGA